MLGIGMGEMLLIGAIALIVFGPEKFPDFAKIALRTMRDLRGYVEEIQGEVSKELKPIKKEIDKLARDSEKYIDTIAKDTDKVLAQPNTTSTPAAKPQADPTDRQDDSFDYGDTAGTGKADGDVKGPGDGGAQGVDEHASAASGQQASNASVDGKSAETPSVTAEQPQGFEEPESPVERLG